MAAPGSKMSLSVFSPEGASILREALNASSKYREAAADWEGSLLLAVGDASDGNGAAVFLDLWHGECRAARPPVGADREAASFVITASADAWEDLLVGGIDPLPALMGGKLQLVRGRLFSLLPHARSARQLVAVAAVVNRSLAADEQATDSSEPDPRDGDDDSVRHGRRRYRTTSADGLDYSHPALRLWVKAKRHGIWDPFAIKFERDRRDWQGLAPLEQRLVLHLTSQFQAGEESVTLDLLPLIGVIAREGRLEEEMYLTSFLWEEAKHVELFRRFLDEVAEEQGDLSTFHGDAYRTIFGEALPAALERLTRDSSPEAQADAAVTYNMIVEGVLAETGYHAYHQMLEANDVMPGMQRAIALLKRDESRHIAYGVFLLSRLVAEHGAPVWTRIDRRMGELLPVALDSVKEVFEAYDEMPFGLELEHFVGFATDQFERRYRRIELARRQSLEEVFRQAAD